MAVSPIARDDETEPEATAFVFGMEFGEGRQPRDLGWEDCLQSAETPPGAWRWLHFNRLRPETRLWMETQPDLDETVVSALLQTETRPRCVSHDGSLLLNLRGVNFNPGAEPEDMISIRIYARHDLIVSARSYPVRAAREVLEDLRRRPDTRPGDLLIALASRLADNFAPLIEQLREDADEFEDALLSGKRPAARDLAEFRRTILILRRYILPQREAILGIMREAPQLIETEHAADLRETGDKITRIAEELDMVRERAAVLQEQIEAERHEQQNRRLLALSVISVIFLPLTFFTGLMGMNVSGIPFATADWAFLGVCAFIAVAAAGLAGLLKWRRWF
jgi:zinc transporter